MCKNNTIGSCLGKTQSRSLFVWQLNGSTRILLFISLLFYCFEEYLIKFPKLNNISNKCTIECSVNSICMTKVKQRASIQCAFYLKGIRCKSYSWIMWLTMALFFALYASLKSVHWHLVFFRTFDSLAFDVSMIYQIVYSNVEITVSINFDVDHFRSTWIKR